jgi:hypothetical protein
MRRKINFKGETDRIEQDGRGEKRKEMVRSGKRT